MSVALPGGPSTRAAMGDLQDTASDGDQATVDKVHVYLLDGSNIIQAAEEFERGTDDFDKLTSTTPVGADENTGGYKFLNVDKAVTKALVIANPQGALAKENAPISSVDAQMLKAKINEVVYAASGELTAVGGEPYGVDPTDDNRMVKKAELDLTASMNRFQVTGTKFIKVVWQNGKRRKPSNGAQTGCRIIKVVLKTMHGMLSRPLPMVSTVRYGMASLTSQRRPL